MTKDFRNVLLELLMDDPVHFTAKCVLAKTNEKHIFVFRVVQINESTNLREWQLEQFSENGRDVYRTTGDSPKDAIRKHIESRFPVSCMLIHPLFPVMFRQYEKGMLTYDLLSKMCWG
jgi:hypothetical protein